MKFKEVVILLPLVLFTHNIIFLSNTFKFLKNVFINMIITENNDKQKDIKLPQILHPVVTSVNIFILMDIF